jgi:ATP-dependent Clp protease ATP-binding subunit ClpA
MPTFYDRFVECVERWPKNVALEIQRRDKVESCTYAELRHWAESVGSWLAKNGFDSRYGARPMARLIHNKIKQPLANEILFGKLSHGGSALVRAADDDLTLDFS